MRSTGPSTALLLCILSHCDYAEPGRACRNVPGSPGYPDSAAWNAFNDTISGRLVSVVPSAKFCADPLGGYTDVEWSSALFRNTIPGAMISVNWEQGYDFSPPSLCYRNGTTCGQGDVPLYSVEVETVTDIQAAVKFASAHHLRVAIKSSGHDSSGRSTAPQSLLIHTNKLNSISFADNFFVGTQNRGAAVTVGSGVHMNDLYQHGKVNGKIAVGATAATVCAAGGYVQGAGHSALAPAFGLGADNVLEFQIVVASGELLRVNSVSNSDLFYALRGGGAGSWGVIVSASFRTFPTFNATATLIALSATDNTAMAALATLHAKHIFDLDGTRSGGYFYLHRDPTGTASTMTIESFLINQTVAQSEAILAPFLTAAQALPNITITSSTYTSAMINDLLFIPDDKGGTNLVGGSRLIPTATYRDSPEMVGKVYQRLLDSGAQAILGNLVAGGQVAANAYIASAVTPAWRTAKTHIILSNQWLDSIPVDQIDAARTLFKNTQLPILEQMSGPNAGSYSNEADVMEAHFQTTFYGPNYGKFTKFGSWKLQTSKPPRGSRGVSCAAKRAMRISETSGIVGTALTAPELAYRSSPGLRPGAGDFGEH
ncbi:FAD-binding domain-containing protein [Mycena metata]|uniref:FAD-binding domain-containing protein n=1 Tax=Mycena metata TaxID=1033252 RepID=A0AAD7MTA7_9AGAR|nr:FAD-binding domain-containing protein [Mycena metata]